MILVFEINVTKTAQVINWLFAYNCRLLITYANSLDPDKARQNVRP